MTGIFYPSFFAFVIIVYVGVQSLKLKVLYLNGSTYFFRFIFVSRWESGFLLPVHNLHAYSSVITAMNNYNGWNEIQLIYI